MDIKSLKRLLPRDKDDAESARALVALGYPTVAPVMPQMLDWLKSGGSPVEGVMREFLASLGSPAVPAELGTGFASCVVNASDAVLQDGFRREFNPSTRQIVAS